MILPNIIILTNTRGSVWQRSIGAYQVAHHCRKHGFSAQVIDFTDFFTKEELIELISKMYSSKLLCLGISTTFYSKVSDDANPVLSANAGSDLRGTVDLDNNIKEVFEYVKKNFPDVKIIAGGANSWQMVDNKLVDAVFHGYSEESVVKYMQRLQSGKKTTLNPKKGNVEIINGDIETFKIETLDHIWQPQDIVLPKETLPIEIARGCIFKCKFCSYPLNGKKKFDYIRDYSLIKEELEYNYKMYGTTNYFFTDDTFNDSTEKIKDLHNLFTSLSFKIGFVCYLRADLLYRHPEQITLLKEMGLNSVVFGVESLHHGAAKSIGKGMHPDKLKKFLIDLYYKHWDEKISITCSMIIGLPGEDEEHVRSVFNWFRNEGRDLCDSWWPLTISTAGHYLSAFEKDHSRYGYKLNEKGEEWTTDIMTYSQAFALSTEFNNVGMLRDNHPGSWMIQSLRSYDYSLDELMTWQVKDMPWKTLIRKRLRMVKSYKDLLTQLING
jgi:radical SAM superfamily enzyme YgiQ (UPF0313 family)